jgi:hypothetical protein
MLHTERDARKPHKWPHGKPDNMPKLIAISLDMMISAPFIAILFYIMSRSIFAINIYTNQLYSYAYFLSSYLNSQIHYEFLNNATSLALLPIKGNCTACRILTYWNISYEVPIYENTS